MFETDKWFYEFDGVEYFEDEKIIAKMLIEGDLEVFPGEAVNQIDKDEPPEEVAMLYLNCSDVFIWGCADWEPVTLNDIREIYKMSFENLAWCCTRWVCKKRNLQPQGPIIKDMKRDAAWCEMMENLPKQWRPRKKNIFARARNKIVDFFSSKS